MSDKDIDVDYCMDFSDDDDVVDSIDDPYLDHWYQIEDILKVLKDQYQRPDKCQQKHLFEDLGSRVDQILDNSTDLRLKYSIICDYIQKLPLFAVKHRKGNDICKEINKIITEKISTFAKQCLNDVTQSDRINESNYFERRVNLLTDINLNNIISNESINFLEIVVTKLSHMCQYMLEDKPLKAKYFENSCYVLNIFETILDNWENKEADQLLGDRHLQHWIFDVINETNVLYIIKRFNNIYRDLQSVVYPLKDTYVVIYEQLIRIQLILKTINHKIKLYFMTCMTKGRAET